MGWGPFGAPGNFVIDIIFCDSVYLYVCTCVYGYTCAMANALHTGHTLDGHGGNARLYNGMERIAVRIPTLSAGWGWGVGGGHEQAVQAASGSRGSR
jgi:hypothetical protein